MRIAVLSGGRSSEHDVSRASAASVAAALGTAGHEVIPVLIGRDGAWTLDADPVALVPGSGGRARIIPINGGPGHDIDVVFPVLHGPWGEDGTVQGLCETAGVPYVGADVAASATGMDKALFHVLATAAGIPRVETVVVRHAEWLADPAAVRVNVATTTGFPAFAKPARLGSSFGISPVPGEADLAAALDLAFRHDDKALVERRAVGREVEVGLLGHDDPEASPVGEIHHEADWYDHEAKYAPGGMRLQVPANISPQVAERARSLAVDAWNAIGCSGMARVDFFLEGDNLFVSEINTIPGFTPTSVYARLFEAAGISYVDLVERLVGIAVKRHEARSAYQG